jgi:hypothetical protein
VNKDTEEKIKEIFKKHVGAAIDELADSELFSFYWGENTDNLIAGSATNIIIALQDSEDERQANDG